MSGWRQRQEGYWRIGGSRLGHGVRGLSSLGPAATGDRCCLGRVLGRIAPRARQASSCVRKEGNGRTKKGMSPISAARPPAPESDESQKLDLSPFSPPFPARFRHASSGGRRVADTGGCGPYGRPPPLGGDGVRGRAQNRSRRERVAGADGSRRSGERIVPWCELPSPPTPLPQTGEGRLWRQVIASGSNVRDIPVKPAA